MADRLRWGVLGASAIARNAVIPAIKASANGILAAVASRDAGRARQFAAAVGAPRSHDSYDALIADPTIDAIYNPLPNGLHAEWTLKAAEAGKAVLCEKPLTLDAAEAEHLARGSAVLGVPVMEAFMYRFHPQHRRVREMIADGVIGDVVEVRAHLSVDLMNPPDPANVRFDRGLGGGALLDMGCYGISICRMIFAAEPASVRAWWHVDPDSGVDITAAVILEFSGGRVGLASCSFVGNGQGFYTVIGRRGSIEVPRGIIPGQGQRVPEALVIVADALGNRREEVFAALDQYRLMVENFGAAVLSGNPVPLPLSDSIANMRVLDAAARAARSGRTESVPAD